jgi:hypothetical protein
MAGQVFPPLLHLDENNGIPDQISEGRPLPVAFLDAHLESRAGLGNPLVTKPPKEAIKEDLSLRLLVPSDVRANPRNKFRQPPRSLGFRLVRFPLSLGLK